VNRTFRFFALGRTNTTNANNAGAIYISTGMHMAGCILKL